jgi:hypothetical protein
MTRCLRVYITESDRAITFEYERRRNHSRNNLAEKAVSHRRDLNVWTSRLYR